MQSEDYRRDEYGNTWQDRRQDDRLSKLERNVAVLESRDDNQDRRLDDHDKQFDNIRAEHARFPQTAAVIVSLVIAGVSALAAMYGAGLIGP